ncbi:TadE/TadG family type IV pilus assembly protein [Streptomyces sp.]|uniref:TadE/TadG family type IV pilus assembly protein n=1 Tax=Streptomyces sp. TaxID=1931 RepID=UPI0028127EE1|nr:TadE/TadG family type IV pilus assembly protein [Streptomyces sp.]
MKRWHSERGAAAVEFALVLPMLLFIMLGIIEFGRAYNTQISLTHAARETARYMAIHKDSGDATTIGVGAAPSVGLKASHFTFSTETCPKESNVHVTITYNLKMITGVGGDMTLTGKAAMRCGG